MSSNLKSKKVVLFGPGNMGIEYAKVLKHLGIKFDVVGRNGTDVERFYARTGIQAIPNGFSAWQKRAEADAEYAIVAVNVEELSKTALNLMGIGVKKILLEKPGGLNAEEIKLVRDKAESTKTKIYVGYNRRFYASVLKAQEIIREDGGVISFNFEFTEWTHTMHEAIDNEDVKRNWFLVNSTHVIDLAFLLGGIPQSFKTYTAGGCDWHPAATIFAGAGVTRNGALFSYQANWFAPGRWSAEFLTNQHRLIFRPLEKLQVQLNKSVKIDFIDIDDRLDIDFKPGLLGQTEYFLRDVDHPNFVNIDEHYQNVVNYFLPILKQE